MLRAELRVIGGKHHGKLIPFTTQKFLIGREQDCQLRPNSELVSRHHCVFTADDYGVRIRDLGSTNGTFVNDERIQGQRILKSGDRVRIGKLEFKVLFRKVEAGEPSTASGSETVVPALAGETDEMANSDTSTEFDLPSPQSLSDSNPAGDTDTTIMLPPANQNGGSQPQPAPPAYQPAHEHYPQQQPPPYYPPGGYPQPYPYQPPGMPYPQMGGYPQPPGMVYPQQAPYYPPQQQPPMPEMPDMDDLPEPPSESGSSTVPAPPVILPDPSTTGAKEEQPPPAKENAKDDESTKKNPPENPSNMAADIIRQHLQRRPGPKKD